MLPVLIPVEFASCLHGHIVILLHARDLSSVHISIYLKKERKERSQGKEISFGTLVGHVKLLFYCKENWILWYVTEHLWFGHTAVDGGEECKPVTYLQLSRQSIHMHTRLAKSVHLCCYFAICNLIKLLGDVQVKVCLDKVLDSTSVVTKLWMESFLCCCAHSLHLPELQFLFSTGMGIPPPGFPPVPEPFDRKFSQFVSSSHQVKLA